MFKSTLFWILPTAGSRGHATHHTAGVPKLGVMTPHFTPVIYRWSNERNSHSSLLFYSFIYWKSILDRMDLDNGVCVLIKPHLNEECACGCSLVTMVTRHQTNFPVHLPPLMLSPHSKLIPGSNLGVAGGLSVLCGLRVFRLPSTVQTHAN